ncbi:recombinase family protein [Hydrogenophaga taeniospiralis]|uniref:recombinase family protein n=1 Tax=Hydrogenophaga taeniospiralis TaxID=65656 RepID=UPI001CFA2E45|nr:recombinase family protein [Hydrogenophaga taeniospiralis]UCU92377.1 recombinase family protein [Hydrogenophaga taeniospiralis]
MNKISPEHLARGAYVYVRQSTADQLRHNHESRRRQYALAERARTLGWSEVVVIDDDLGVSASGVARPGFERLLVAICGGQVGAVVSIEASRLARNGRDWHTLLEFCALVGCVIVDEDGVYDPRSVNDRLLLGMKGTMSEMELSLLRQRSVEALKLKAARGDLYTTVAIGYVRSEGDRIELDADLRIREAIAAVFTRFALAGSVRQVLLWFRQERIELPAAVYDEGRRTVVWRLPVYNTVLKILTNPVYAGAYAFGRTETRVRIEAGRKRVVRGHRRAQEHWQVLIQEHHDGYIDWNHYEHNQRVIADNTNMRGSMARGALRRGEALLTGLLRCAHCGRKLHVAYSGADGDIARYHCKGAAANHGSPQGCISFGSLRVDEAVSREVLSVLRPVGVQAALHAIEQRAGDDDAKRRQLELALEQARFEAARAQRQFDVVDPGNRLVAAELERRWNERLAEISRREAEIEALQALTKPPLSPGQRADLIAMGADLPQAWSHPAAGNEVRKRILRCVIREIVARIVETSIELVIHWQGGDHTVLSVVKNRVGQHRWTTDVEVQTLITQLARQLNDGTIASLLNRLGHRSAKGHTWTEMRVRSFRGDHRIAVYKAGEREARGELTLEQAADALGASKMTVLRMIGAGSLQGTQACKGAPWIIKAIDVQRPEVRAAVTAPARGPLPEDPRQFPLDIQ